MASCLLNFRTLAEPLHPTSLFCGCAVCATSSAGTQPSSGTLFCNGSSKLSFCTPQFSLTATCPASIITHYQLLSTAPRAQAQNTSVKMTSSAIPSTHRATPWPSHASHIICVRTPIFCTNSTARFCRDPASIQALSEERQRPFALPLSFFLPQTQQHKRPEDLRAHQ